MLVLHTLRIESIFESMGIKCHFTKIFNFLVTWLQVKAVSLKRKQHVLDKGRETSKFNYELFDLGLH